ncbi:MAG: T9SS type A sorting domain-containing protein [Clostridia bacterium]|nr:T9SS type A sorting domain-containing protein [Clostridia bacterium]
MKKNVFSPVFITMFIMIPVMLVCQVPDISLMHKQQKQTLVTPSGNDNPVKISKASPGGSSPNLTDSETIRWDNGTNSGIAGITGGGIFEVAAFFPASLMIQYVGYALDKVEIYIGDNPVSCELRIYGQGTSNSPGMLLRSQSVTTTPNSWNLINLSNQLDITGQGLWISYSLDHLDGTSPVGIDSGPAITGYGDMISFSGGSWYTLSSMGYSYNWNIAGYLSFICGSNIGDGQGNVYNTTEIGNQCWMLENLNIGSFINSSTNQTNNGAIEKYCYNNLESWCDLYGGLYQWNEIMQYNSIAGSRGICPEGWHIPAIDEWAKLIEIWGGQSLAGEPMKSVRTEPEEHPRWDYPNIATNLSFFSALPGGVYQNEFTMLGMMGYWWSSTEILLTPYASYISLSNSVPDAGRCGNDTSYAYSVRCLLDNSLTGVYAGEDVSICEGEDYQTIASATNYTSVFWSTSGGGVFDNPEMLTPVYTPGLFDIATSVTLCLEVQPINPNDPPVSDCMELFVQPAPIVDAGPDATISEGDVYTITLASASNFSELQWYTPNGTGVFDDPNILNPVYIPSAQDYLLGSVELRLIVNGIAACEPVEDFMIVIFIFPPSANAGSDATICAIENYWLYEASATNYSSLFWDNSSGDGYFITPTILNPVYVPGPDDIATGSVELCLIASPNGYSFFPAVDCMTLTIDLQPETCCCPEFILKDAVEICPPPGACDSEPPANIKSPYYSGPSMAACKDITHTYTVYPNNPGLYNYSWEITGGTPLTYSGNPISILWGSGNRGFIKVIITGEYCNDTIIQEICLVDGPEADFIFEPDTVCINSSVNFYNTSVGGSTYHWDFGNGMVSTKFNPSTVSYDESGTYTIILSVTNSFYPDTTLPENEMPCGCIDIISKTITVLAEEGPKIEIDCCHGTVCPGGTSSFSTLADCNTYVWSVTGGTITSGDNTQNITVQWDATYPGNQTTVTLELPECEIVPCPGSTTIIVPVIYDNYPISGPGTICKSSSGTYCLPVWPGTYYTWTVIPIQWGGYQFNKQDRNVANVNISFFDIGTYVVKCEYTNPMIDCNGTTTLIIEVLPILSFMGYDEVCEGSTTYYYANGNVNWSVTPNEGVSINPTSGTSTNVSWSSPGEYVVIATPVSSGDFCNEKSFKVINVIEKPVLGDIEGFTLVCPAKNQTYSITSNVSGSQFQWAIDPVGYGNIHSLMGADNDSVVVQWIGSGPWQLKVRQSRQLLYGDCPSDWKVIDVIPFPSPIISGVNLVCADVVGTYLASGVAPPEGYNWSVVPIEKGTILSGNGTNQVSILWHGGGVATGLVMVEHCGGSASMEVVVNDLPPAELTLDIINSPPGTEHPVFCQTDLFNLTLSTPNCPDSEYQWYNNGIAFSGNFNSITLTNLNFTAPGIYKFYVEVIRNGCTARSNIVIIEIKNCEPGCPGGCPGFGECLAYAWFWTYQDCEKVYLINKSEISYFIETYQWSVTPSGTATISTPNARDAVLTATASGNYTIQLEITDVNGCTRSFSKNVQILLPFADFTFTTPVCEGQPVFFSAIPNNPVLYDYYWIFGDGYTSSLAEPHYTFDPDNANVNLTIKDRYGCEASFGLSLEMNPVPVCEITASNTHFCPDGFVTLTASSGMEHYQWCKDYEPVAGATNAELLVYQHGEYYVEATNVYGCTCNSESIYIFMHPLPVAKITGDTYVCSGNSFYLETPFNNNYSYNWSEVSGETGATFTPISWHNARVVVDLSPGVTGQYIFSVLVTDITTGCTAMDYVCVTINETPELSFVTQTACEDNPITLSPDPNDPDTYFYQWSNGQTDPEITVSTPGEYWLTISNKLTGCNATAYAATIFPKPDLSLFPYGCNTVLNGEQVDFYIPLPLNNNKWFPNTIAATYDSILWYDYNVLMGTNETYSFIATASNTGEHEISVKVENYHGCENTAGVYCLKSSKDCPNACENFDDGIHNFISYNEHNGTITNPPIIVIESPGSGDYPGDLGMRVTDRSGGTWIYDTVNYGGNYLACNENCLCWDMNVEYNDPSITSYYPYIYFFKGFDPFQPISSTNPEFWARFTSNSPAGYQEWVNTCAPTKASPDGVAPPSSEGGAWAWSSESSMPWNEFISDIQGIMFRVDVTGWGSQAEKIRYDSICLGCSPCPNDTTICCDSTVLLSTSNFTDGVFSGPFVSKVGDDYKFKMECENFPTPTPPDYESYSQDYEIAYEYADAAGNTYTCYFTITVDYNACPPPDCPGLDTIVCLDSEPFWHGFLYIDPSALGLGTHYFDCVWSNACLSCQWSSVTWPPTPNVRRKVTVLAPNANGYSIPDVTVCKSDPPFWHWDRWIYPNQYAYGSANTINYTYIDPCGDTVQGSFTIYVRGWDFICNPYKPVFPDEWYIVSSYVQPITPYPFPGPTPIIDIFEPEIYLGHFEVGLGNGGILWPSGGINTIGNWDVYQGYKIKMNAPGWIELTGEIPEDKTIHLDAGANYIPVLSQEFYPADDILGQLGEGLIFAYDLRNELLWWPQGGIYTLDVFEPGKGYLVGMSQPGQATYEPTKANIQNHVPARPKVYENAPWSVSKSGSTHFVSVERSALGELAFGDFIGVFNTEGVCAGFTQVDEATGNILLVAYGNDFTVKANTGLADSENMTFRIFRTATGAETSASVSFDAAMPNTGFYAENGLSMIVNIKTGATSLAENDLNKIHIYPNPSNGTFTIEGMHEKINVRIFNAFGGEVYLDELNLPARVDLSAQPKGIYFISIETGNSTFFKKLVIH